MFGLFKSRRRGRSRRSSSRSLLGSIPILRWFGPGLTLGGIVMTGLAVLTGQIDLPSLDQYRGETAPIELQPVRFSQLGEREPNRIRIATFNIKQFAENKANNRPVMTRIAQVVSALDLIAIQEVMSGSSLPIDRLVDILNRNAGRPRYQSLVSQPIGRTSHKESYAYVFDSDRIQFVQNSAYVVEDGGDLMHREPFVATFQARTATGAPQPPFRFTIINVHTDPDEIATELNVMADVFNSVRAYEYATNREEDFIIAGDLNTSVRDRGDLFRLPGITTLAAKLTTNLKRTKQLDHLLIDRSVTTEFMGVAGVIDFVNDFGMTSTEAAKISDHLPVFAEFSAFEQPVPSRNPSVAGSRQGDPAVR